MHMSKYLILCFFAFTRFTDCDLNTALLFAGSPQSHALHLHLHLHGRPSPALSAFLLILYLFFLLYLKKREKDGPSLVPSPATPASACPLPSPFTLLFFFVFTAPPWPTVRERERVRRRNVRSSWRTRRLLRLACFRPKPPVGEPAPAMRLDLGSGASHAPCPPRRAAVCGCCSRQVEFFVATGSGGPGGADRRGRAGTVHASRGAVHVARPCPAARSTSAPCFPNMET